MRRTGRPKEKKTVYICVKEFLWKSADSTQPARPATVSEVAFMELDEALFAQRLWCESGRGRTARVLVIESVPVDVRHHKGHDTAFTRSRIMCDQESINDAERGEGDAMKTKKPARKARRGGAK